MSQINKKHLKFMDECRHVFNEQILRETHINEDGDLIGLRYGADRDCIQINELGQEIGFFSQMMHPTTSDQFIEAVIKNYGKVSSSALRPELKEFAIQMELQLRANDHKNGWEDCSHEYLFTKISDNITEMHRCVSHSEFRRRCANIANFAMMLADNDRRDEADRS